MGCNQRRPRRDGRLGRPSERSEEVPCQAIETTLQVLFRASDGDVTRAPALLSYRFVPVLSFFLPIAILTMREAQVSGQLSGHGGVRIVQKLSWKGLP